MPEKLITILTLLVFGITPSVFADNETTRMDHYGKTILVEQGNIIPALSFDLFFDEYVEVDSHRVDMKIMKGNASFLTEGQLTQSSEKNDQIPEILSNGIYSESFLKIKLNKKKVIIRIVTLPKGGIENISAYFGEYGPGIIELKQYYAIVDESKLDINDDSGISQQSSLKEDMSRFQGNGINTDNRIFGSEKDDNIPGFDKESAETTDVCIRSPFGPGIVNWNIADPSGPGWKYSVKPENSTPLIWAAAPSQAIDGVYRSSWGCGYALKVPDSCTLTINDGSASSCCNAAMAQLGYVVEWVNPGSIGWVNCPLY